MKRVDVRGMSCPQPVLMTKNAINNHPQEIEILVDNNTAKKNVNRFLQHSGYKVNFEDLDEDIIITARK